MNAISNLESIATSFQFEMLRLMRQAKDGPWAALAMPVTIKLKP
jgi:hypothetical protein